MTGIFSGPATPIVSVGAGNGAVQKGIQTISSATLAAATKLTVPAGAVTAVVYPTGTGVVNWRSDGTAPTGTTGIPLAANAAPLVFSGAEMAAVQFIEASGGAVVLNVAFY